MKNRTTEKPDSEVRILKTAICPSLSGKSKLTYEIGYEEKVGIQFRVIKNSAAGCFNPEWVSLKSIEGAFAKIPKEEAVTAVNLMGLFRDMSANTPFFVFAALKNEGLVELSRKHRRSYERVDSAAFLERMQPFIEGKVPPQGLKKQRKGAAAKATAPKKATTSRKKQKSPS